MALGSSARINQRLIDPELDRLLLSDILVVIQHYDSSQEHRMLKAFLDKFTAPNPEPFTEEDCRMALTVLLVRVARSDGDYSLVEQERIERIVTSRYALAQEEAEALRSEAEELESLTPDNVQFTRSLKILVPFDEREELLEALWMVVLADGTRDYQEDGFLRLVARLLGISDRDSAFARQRVESRMTAASD